MPQRAPRRRRRTAADAKQRILDAAQKRLAEGGPEAIRLQDLARDLGISHPTILHHFGSREGLMQAVEAQALKRLQADLLAPPSRGDALERVYRTLGDEGTARLLAWLVLQRAGSGVGPSDGQEGRMLRTLAHALHEERLAAGTHPPLEESIFETRLVAAAMFGEALLGPLLSWSAGLEDDPTVPQRFRLWLTDLLMQRHGSR